MDSLEPILSEATRRELEALEAEHWRRRKIEFGVWEGLRIAAELRAQILSVRPDWPRPEERAEDLAQHVRVGSELRRVSRGE